ncbi:MAG: pyridoxamine 5'-phosphate oxidase [Mycobacteriales bacterium]
MEDEVLPAPGWLAQFRGWLAEAQQEPGIAEPTAMVLATADADGRPSARTVLCKEVDERGLVFYTNLRSRKGWELAENPRASVVFPWYPLRRQVVVLGDVEQVERGQTGAYARSRARASQVSAWASRQSEVIGSREQLEERFAELDRRWPQGTPVPVPPFWGGWRLRPASVEFWVGRRDRLHDRLRYRRDGASWVIERLAP